MEELLLDMKSDVSKLSMELTKLPSVSKQLKIDEISTLGKLAHKDPSKKPLFLPQPASVITQNKTSTSSTTVTPNESIKPLSTSQSKPDSENVILLSNTTSTAVSALQFIQQKPQTTSASQYSTATAINMSPFVSDGTTLLMPAAQGTTLPMGQQVLYWAPGSQVVQSSQGTTILASQSVTSSTVATASATRPLTQQTTPSAVQLLKPDRDSLSGGTKKVIHIE